MSQSTNDPKVVESDGRSSAPSNPRTEDCSQVTRPAPEFTILKARPNPQSIAPAESPPEDSAKESTGVQEETAAALSLSSSLVSGAMENLDLNDNADGDDGQVELDEFLVSALRNRTERLFLLRLDREFGNFINSSQEQLQFPSMNSYHRMVVHRVANYFNLKRFVDPQSKAIILSRTEKSAIPTLRFSDLVEEEEEQTIKPMILLRRDPKRLASGMATPDGSSETDRRFVPIKVREEAYAKARARIFDGQPAKPKSPGEGSESTSRSNSPSIGPIGSDSARLEMEDEASKQSKTKKQPSNRRQGSSSARSPDEQVDSDYIRQLNTSSPNSRNVSRSTSPSFGSSTEAGARTPNKGLKPKTKVSIGDLAVECVDSRRRKSTISNASISSSNYKPSVGLARTISSSSSQSQDGFLSPGSNPPFTESPTLSTPMNLSKGPDYFGHHPSSSQGTISPMGGVGSRSSYTYPQGPGANKNIRNQGANFNQMNPINQMPNLGYNKNANGQAFGSKKFQKGSNHNNGGGGFNQNPMSHVSGPPNAAYPYTGNGGLFNPNINSNGINSNNNGTNNQYTHHPNANPGHDPSSYFGPLSDSAAPHHSSHGPPSYAFTGAQGQFPHMPNAGFSHHPGPNHQPNYYNSSHRGGRRFNNNYNQYSHPPQTHHQHHTRNHPQPHAPYQQGNPHHKHNNNNNNNNNNINNNININNNNNFNNHTPRDDPSFSQGGPIGTRGMRMYDNMNPGFGQPPHGADFSGHVLNAGGEFHGGPNMYPGYGGGHPQIPTGDNPPNAHRHRSYDGSWTGGTNHPQDTQGHSFNGAMSQTPAGGKKPFNNYSSVPPMNQHHFPPIGGGGGHQGPVNGGSVMQQPGSMMPLSNAGGAGGPMVYDVDRRPPKSSELFDPNGPQPQSSSSSSNSGMGYAGNSQQGSGDAVNVALVDGSNQGFGAYSNPHQGQFQGQQQGSHTNTHHPLPHQAHASQYHHHSVPMNRSYSSSSSSGYGGSTSSPGPNANKKSSLLYDYSGLTAPFDSARSSSTDTERSPAMNHILEICDFDLQDEKLFMEIVAPLNGKLRRLKTNSNNNSISINQCNSSGSAGNGSSKESAGQCVVIFKNAAVATEALAAFQEGRETWMAAGAQLRFESSAEEEEEKGDEVVDQLPTSNTTDEAAPLSETAPSPRSSSAASSPMPSFSPSSSSPSSSPSLQPLSTTAATTTTAETRKQWRFNLRVWTPVLTNSTVPTGGSVVAGSSSPSRGILPVGVSPNSNSGVAGGSQHPGGVSSSLSRSESLEYTLHPCTEAGQQCPDQDQDEVELDESQQGNNEEDEEEGGEEEEGRASTLVSAVAQDEGDSGRR